MFSSGMSFYIGFQSQVVRHEHMYTGARPNRLRRLYIQICRRRDGNGIDKVLMCTALKMIF